MNNIALIFLCFPGSKLIGRGTFSSLLFSYQERAILWLVLWKQSRVFCRSTLLS